MSKAKQNLAELSNSDCAVLCYYLLPRSFQLSFLTTINVLEVRFGIA